MYFLYYLALYLIIVFLLTRLFIPYFGFVRAPIVSNLPDDLNIKIKEWEKKATTKEDYLKFAYGFIIGKYHGSRAKTITQLYYVYKNALKHEEGFMTCNNQNFLLRNLLVHSKFFSEDEIKICFTPLNLVIHQYLKVKISGKWIPADTWANALGVSFGNTVKLFN